MVRKYICIALIVIFGCGVMGCSVVSNTKLDESMIKIEESSQIQAEDKENTNTIIHWLLPDYAMILDDRIPAVNRLLRLDGYNVIINVDYMDYSGKSDRLEKAISSGKYDLVYIGTNNLYESFFTSDIIRAGGICVLDNLLTSEAGQKLKTAMPEAIWDASKIDGVTYFVPNEALTYFMSYAAFRKDTFDDALENDTFAILKELTDEGVRPGNPKIVGDFDYSIICQVNGYLDVGGIAAANIHTGEFINPLEDRKIVESIVWRHEMEKQGMLVSSSVAIEEGMYREASVIMPYYGQGVFSVNEEEWTLVPMEYSIPTTANGGTGICSNSQNKEAAIEVLSLLHADEEYANLLIWGTEGEDYQVQEDGYLYRMDSSIPYGFVAELTTGVYNRAYHTVTENYGKDTLNNKIALATSDCRIENCISGFVADYNIENIDYEMLSELIAFCTEPGILEFQDERNQIYLQKNSNMSIDKLLELASDYFQLYGGDKLIEELNRQRSEWEKSRK